MFRVFSLLVIAGLCLFTPIFGCPLCSEGVSNANPANQEQLARSFNQSIIVMIASPFLLTGLVAAVLMRIIKR